MQLFPAVALRYTTNQARETMFGVMRRFLIEAIAHVNQIILDNRLSNESDLVEEDSLQPLPAKADLLNFYGKTLKLGERTTSAY